MQKILLAIVLTCMMLVAFVVLLVGIIDDHLMARIYGSVLLLGGVTMVLCVCRRMQQR